jgi:hypothetical protein
LQEAGSFRAKSSRLFQGYAQELQASINQELLETMHDAELQDWDRFGKIRQAKEKRLRDPADVNETIGGPVSMCRVTIFSNISSNERLD